MNLIDIFTENLIYYRKKRGFSQESLAEKCNLHRTYISLLERKQRNVTLKNIEKLAKALDIEPYELLKEEKNNC